MDGSQVIIFYIYCFFLKYHLAHLGVFVPYFSTEPGKSGYVHLNKWNEVMFLAPEGAHRCSIQAKKYMENPDLPFEKICCFGKWDPTCNHTTQQGQILIKQYGTLKNTTNRMQVDETYCDMIKQYIDVF
jgi:hypothetical protein